MSNLRHSRRRFVKNALVIGAGIPATNAMSAFLPPEKNNAAFEPVPLKWLDDAAPQNFKGTTWGVPWQKGQIKSLADIGLQNAAGEAVPVQNWPTAHWPDGSVKWSAHAMAAQANTSPNYNLVNAKTTSPKTSIKVTEKENEIWVDTGIITCRIAKNGQNIIPAITRNGKTIAANGQLVMLNQNLPEAMPDKPLVQTKFTGSIGSVTIEQKGPLRTVILLKGTHANASGRNWLPFVLRLYFFAGSEAIQLMHTIVYDGNEEQDFIKGLGICFDMPLTDALYNRHIRFAGEEPGIFGEAVQGLTGLRRDPGQAVKNAQLEGRATPDISSWQPAVSKGLPYISAFGDYSLSQLSPDSFGIKKRTRAGFGWVQSAQGKRSAGTAYLGGPSGGLAFGIRNFWQSHPAQLDVHNAHTPTAQITLWFWAPEAAAMDLRFYHDGMGQDTHQKQLDALDITYEDYEPGFGRPVGVARTSEAQIWALDATPTHEKLAAIAQNIQQPARIMATPQYLQQAGAFGGNFTVAGSADAPTMAIEKQLDFYVDYYCKQVENHSWYGFWNYGDFMHTYDADRNMWRYDVGGFAWDNSELSTDIWLWLHFLRTGKGDAFRLAEAMTRHTGEVDVHHTGPFAPLGSRHNVMHWGCSAKQMRISTAANRRYYYYLTADERVGDLMTEQLEAYETLLKIAPGRKLGRGNVQQATEKTDEVNMAFGTDWGSVAAAWLTHYERTGDPVILKKLTNSMETIASQPHGFFTGGGGMNLQTGKFSMGQKGRISASHLNAVFGLPEICSELLATFEMPAFEKAWLQYCRLYNASANEQAAELGEPLKKLNLGQGHSRLTAYAAFKQKDPMLAKRAWQEFYRGEAGIRNPTQKTRKIAAPQVLKPLEVADGVSTNAVAQWGLAAIQCLAYAGAPDGK